MNHNEYIEILGVVIAFLIGILAYFMNKWINGLEENIKSLSAQQSADNKSVQKMIEENTLKLNLLIKNNETQVMLLKQSLGHISTKVESLEKLTDSMKNLDGKIIQLDTKFQSLGKVTHIGRRNK